MLLQQWRMNAMEACAMRESAEAATSAAAAASGSQGSSTDVSSTGGFSSEWASVLAPVIPTCPESDVSQLADDNTCGYEPEEEFIVAMEGVAI
jgi:hypothetical protein